MQSIDWTAVLVFGVPAYIAAIFAGIAALRAAKLDRKLQTSNGATVGQMVEQTRTIVERSADGASADTPGAGTG